MRKHKMKMKNRYFGQNLDMQIQFYNLLSFIGIMTGIIVAIITVIIKGLWILVVIDLIISALFFLLLIVAEKKNCYRLCSWILVITIFMITFPVMFIYFNGYMSGFQCFFVLAIIYTSHLLEKHDRMIAIAFEFVLYSACCLAVCFLIETDTGILSELRIIKMTLNFVFSSALLLLLIILYNRMLNIRQEQVQELNRELVVRNETLAQYDTMKSDFLGTVAHEINTPLAVIAASSSDTLDLLKEIPLNIEEMVENQIIINRRVKLIDNILLGLMDTVAIETGRLSLNRQSVNLSALLKNICEDQFNKLDINGNSIAFDLQPELPDIWVDPLLMEQVMTNLLSNAVRHTKDGMVTVKLVRTDHSQIVSVTDNGEGMDEEMARIVLKQYVSTKADYWRHGIGLYTCRRIIAAHGGDIWIDSVKGRGTTISFSIKEDHDHDFEWNETFNTNHGR